MTIGILCLAVLLGVLTNVLTILWQSRALEKRMDLNKELVMEATRAFRVETLAEFRRLETKIDSRMELHVAKMHK